MALFYQLQGKGNDLGTQSANLTFKISEDGTGATALIVGGVTLHAGYAVGDPPPLEYVWLWWRFLSPATFANLVKNDINVKDESAEVYIGTVSYGPYDYLAKEETTEGGSSTEWSWETKVANAKVTHSIETVNSYKAGGGSGTDFKGAMNVTKDGIQGLDVPKGQSTFTRTYYVSPAAFTDSYKSALEYAVGTMNSASFAGKEPREVMLLGFTASGRGRENVQLQAQFDVSKNATDLSVGDITGIVKKGWNVLWTTNKDEVDETTNRQVKIPVEVHVERVVEETDFEGDLGL